MIRVKYLSNFRWVRLYFTIACMAIQMAGVAYAAPDESLVISGVHSNNNVVIGDEKSVTIKFNINVPAEVTLNIYDARNRLIREISSSGILPAEDHELVWDVLSVHGERVPPGAYYYTLTAKDESGALATHDLTDISGGETVVIDEIGYDPDSNSVKYELKNNARVFVRIGLEGGSVLSTLVNGAIREAGINEEPWDGQDESGVIDLGSHSKLLLFGEGYTLSRNAILVFDEDRYHARPQWIDDGKLSGRVRSPQTRPKGLNLHAYHAPDQCRDARITLSLPGDLPRTEDGLPVISGTVPLRMTVSPEDSMMVESQRFEVVFFLNNRMIYENEISYTPYTWNWNPQAYDNGVNYMTAFIVGFGRHFGVSTVKFVLDKADDQAGG